MDTQTKFFYLSILLECFHNQKKWHKLLQHQFFERYLSRLPFTGFITKFENPNHCSINLISRTFARTSCLSFTVFSCFKHDIIQNECFFLVLLTTRAPHGKRLRLCRIECWLGLIPKAVANGMEGCHNGQQRKSQISFLYHIQAGLSAFPYTLLFVVYEASMPFSLRGEKSFFMASRIKCSSSERNGVHSNC